MSQDSVHVQSLTGHGSLDCTSLEAGMVVNTLSVFLPSGQLSLLSLRGRPWNDGPRRQKSFTKVSQGMVRSMPKQFPFVTCLTI